MIELLLCAGSNQTYRQQKKMVGQVGTNNRFGGSVSLSSDGNTYAIGSPREDNSSGTDDGAVYIWVRDGVNWTEQFKIIPPTEAYDTSLYFGFSVALSSDGNTLAVGAYGTGTGAGFGDRGAVYVYTRTGVTWTLQQRILATGGTGADKFGYSVALSSDGNTLASGAPFDDVTYSDTGTVYVFTRAAGVWSQQQAIQSTDPIKSAYDSFGYDVALSADGNTMAIVSASSAYPSAGVPGFVYIWTRTAGVWTQQQKLIPSGRTEMSCDTVSLSSDGNTCAIGCARKMSAPFHSGSAYVWTRSAGVWTQQQKISNPVPVANDYFGQDVSLSSDGNLLAIGGVQNVHVFDRRAGVWSLQAKLVEPVIGGNFGQCLSLSSTGRTLAIGAQYETNVSGSTAGTAYAYLW